MNRHVDRGPIFPLTVLLPLLVGCALVGVRGEIDPAATAVILAATVVPAARIGGRLGGTVAALMGAAIFDFAHTRPYASLKIDSWNEVLLTVALLVVGLLVGSVTADLAEVRRQEQDRYRASASVTRVLTVAHDGPAADVEAAVRAELIQLLALDECTFTTGDPPLPTLDPFGRFLPGSQVARDGFTLPASGVVVPVEATGRHFGSLVCHPARGVGIPAANCRNALALGEVLGLALCARASA